MITKIGQLYRDVLCTLIEVGPSKNLSTLVEERLVYPKTTEQFQEVEISWKVEEMNELNNYQSNGSSKTAVRFDYKTTPYRSPLLTRSNTEFDHLFAYPV